MQLLIPFVAQPPPLQADDAGVLRVGGTRVRLETIINAFNSGSTAEEILLKYPSLNLTDIYAVITSYLWSREKVDAYLEERRHQEEAVRRENETRFPPAGMRERLLGRVCKPSHSNHKRVAAINHLARSCAAHFS